MLTKRIKIPSGITTVFKAVDEGDKGVSVLDTPGGKQEAVIINESGVYSLIMSSMIVEEDTLKWGTLTNGGKQAAFQGCRFDNPFGGARVRHIYEEDKGGNKMRHPWWSTEYSHNQ